MEQMMQTMPAPIADTARLTRTLVLPDPVRPMQNCVARIDRTQVRLTRRYDNITMHLAIALRDYRGLAVREADSGLFELQLAHTRSDLSLVLGAYPDFESLEQACTDWMALTAKSLMIESETGRLIRVGTRSANRRKGVGSALTYRRGFFAKRRKIGDLTVKSSLRGCREIIARN